MLLAVEIDDFPAQAGKLVEQPVRSGSSRCIAIFKMTAIG